MLLKNGKNKGILTYEIAIITFMVIACFIAFIINMSVHKGILPVIFLLIAVYAILNIISNIQDINYSYDEYINKYITKKFDIKNVIFLVMNIMLFLMSIIILW